MSLKAKLWGVRGSLPSPLVPGEVDNRIKSVLEGFFDAGYSAKADIASYLGSLAVDSLGGYGGNTSCCEIFTDDTSIIIDAGSGIRRKGLSLLAGPCGKGKGEVHLLVSHLHWDHTMGLPFFAPAFIPKNRLHVYSVGGNAEEAFRLLFRKPYFPVPYEALGAEIIYHNLEPRVPFAIGDISFAPYALDHPDPAWGFRFEHGGRVLSYVVDTECTRASRDELGPDLPLYQNVDLLIMDAQYSLPEAVEKVTWGHAAPTIALDIAMRERIPRIIFTHHDPAASDQKITAVGQQTAEYQEYELKHARKANVDIGRVEFLFAQEEMEVEV